DHIDHAGIADRDVEMLELAVQEDHVRRAAQLERAEDRAGAAVDAHQLGAVAGAVQASSIDVEVESVRTAVGNRDLADRAFGSLRIDDDDHGGVEDVDEEDLSSRIEHGPAR